MVGVNKIHIIVLVGACAIAAILAGLGIKHRNATPGDDQLIASSTVSTIPINNASLIAPQTRPAYLTEQYVNTKYGFSFYHSPQDKVTVFEEQDGTTTYVVENETMVRGMQIYVRPYYDTEITNERFAADVPSGKRDNPQDASLDGVRAVTFESFDLGLGETREIWIIRNNNLFEITTFAGAGDWFLPIIQSWKWL